MHEQVERQCPICARTYYANATRLKFGRQTSCSRGCSYKARAAKIRNADERQCGGCRKTILVTPSKAKQARHGISFCSRRCAYANRKRIVERPYVLVTPVDRAALSKKSWETRRRNPKPYPDAAREKARAAAIQRIEHGARVSAFERKAADVFRRLGFGVVTSMAIRRSNGTFAHVIDIVIPARRIAIECHGTYWHGGRWTWDPAPTASQVKNLAYEERKLVTLREAGFDLRLLWEHEFKRDPNGACLAVVR